MLQEGEEALQDQVEGQKSAVEAEGQVVLLCVDELVTWEEGPGRFQLHLHTPFTRALSYASGGTQRRSVSVTCPGVAGLYL